MNEANGPLRVGVIGVGWHGGTHLLNLRANPRAELAAICDVNESLLAERAESLGGVRGFVDYGELLACEDVDAVVIALPDPLHRDAAVAACRAGKHVLLEKPMALTVEDAEAIAQAAAASPGEFMLNLSNRWMHTFAAGKRRIDSGEMGDVRYVFARLSNRIDVPTERLTWLSRSHLAHWIGIHRLDIARWWIGRPAVRVRAVQRGGVLAGRGIDAADFYQATIEFDGGAVVCLEGSWILPPTFPALVDSRFYALCEKGVIEVDRMRSEMALAGSGGFEMSTPSAGTVLDQQDGFVYAASRHFVDCALAGTPPLVSAADGLALTRICCAIVQSCQADGEVVEL